MSDIELLRRFEPVIHYTEGEMFFPSSVDAYLALCSLWLRDADGKETMILPPGHVDSGKLTDFDHEVKGSKLFLRFVDEPLDPIAYQRWLNRAERPLFNSVGRLARVGVVGRLAESLFSLSLLVRGRVVGGTTGKAQMQYRQMMAVDPRYVYYGRVLRNTGYTILHYLFFYPMNDWRSSFHGVNDHESDWEQIFIYLTEEDGDYKPQWVAFAAHDFSGDDLRRRWDDPELQKVGEDHVVVFAGAGSHAAYVLPGEYLMHFEPQALKPLGRVLRPARQFVADNLRTGNSEGEVDLDAPLVSLAFVDYARGDGLAIGPFQDAQWSPELLSEDLPWVSAYRGLWGLDTRDPFGGERAPAGPKFDRDGSVRHSWRDPLGWSGLDKVATPQNLISETEAAVAALEDKAETMRAEIRQQRTMLRMQGLSALAFSYATDLEQQSKLQEEGLSRAEEALKERTATLAALQEEKRLLLTFLARLKAGDRGEPQAHLRKKAVPEPPPPPIAKALDVWAAISGALLISVLILLIAFTPPLWPVWMMLSVLLFGMIEAALRDRLANYLVTATVALAIVGTILLVVEYWRWVIPGGLLFIFLYSLLTNLRELRARL